MDVGQRLLDLRKSKQLSQEEVANELNVTRQTISKWETGQSLPDFDKIIPICKLYGISADELLSGIKNENVESKNDQQVVDDEDISQLKNKKRAGGIGISIIIYFIAIAWIMISIPVLRINPIVASAVFLIICGIATCIIVYSCIVYKKPKTEEEEKQSKIEKQICNVLSIIFLIIYLFVSFTTMAWHITWILWVVYGLIEEIVKLVFMLRGDDNEK